MLAQDTNNRIAIAKAGGIGPLVSLLGCENAKAREHAESKAGKAEISAATKHGGVNETVVRMLGEGGGAEDLCEGEDGADGEPGGGDDDEKEGAPDYGDGAEAPYDFDYYKMGYEFVEPLLYPLPTPGVTAEERLLRQAAAGGSGAPCVSSLHNRESSQSARASSVFRALRRCAPSTNCQRRTTASLSSVPARRRAPETRNRTREAASSSLALAVRTRGTGTPPIGADGEASRPVARQVYACFEAH